MLLSVECPAPKSTSAQLKAVMGPSAEESEVEIALLCLVVCLVFRGSRHKPESHPEQAYLLPARLNS